MTSPLDRTVSIAQRAGVVGQAAQRHRVPVWVLWGIYGIETTFGRNVKTSSAGAIGDFQFLPRTAAQYHYPLTNTPTDAQFVAQADAAAHFLSDLRAQHGSWDAAVRHYSGGGYNLAKVRETANTQPDVGSGVPGADETKRGVEAAAGAVTEWGSALTKLLGFLMTPSTWLRVLKLIGGLVIGFFALKQLAAAGSQSA